MVKREGRDWFDRLSDIMPARLSPYVEPVKTVRRSMKLKGERRATTELVTLLRLATESLVAIYDFVYFHRRLILTLALTGALLAGIISTPLFGYLVQLIRFLAIFVVSDGQFDVLAINSALLLLLAYAARHRYVLLSQHLTVLACRRVPRLSAIYA